MSKVVYKTTTSNNNDFQQVLVRQLKGMDISPNNSLDILVTDDRKIVIQPMGSWSHHINFSADSADSEQKELYRVESDYGNNFQLVMLSQTAIDLLQWLMDNDLTDGDFGYTKVDDMEFDEF